MSLLSVGEGHWRNMCDIKAAALGISKYEQLILFNYIDGACLQSISHSLHPSASLKTLRLCPIMTATYKGLGSLAGLLV